MIAEEQTCHAVDEYLKKFPNIQDSYAHELCLQCTAGALAAAATVPPGAAVCDTQAAEENPAEKPLASIGPQASEPDTNTAGAQEAAEQMQPATEHPASAESKTLPLNAQFVSLYTL